MDLDQQRVTDENANIVIKNNKMKGGKNMKASLKNKRAFGQDLTNKTTKAANKQQKAKQSSVSMKKIEIVEDKQPKAVSQKIQQVAPWDLCVIDEDSFVVDYVEDIMSSLREDEILNRGGCVIENEVDFMGAQKDLNYRMRAVLVDWLIEVHRKFKLLPSTYFLGINMLDRYLAKEQLSRKKLQLAGCCCLWIASKYHEIYAPEMDDFIYISDNAFSESDLVKMEIQILKTLQFSLTVPTLLSFAERYGKIAAFYLVKEREIKIIADLIMFVVESSILSYSLCRKHPSLVAAAAFVYSCMATKVFSIDRFKKDELASVIGYDLKQLLPTLNEIDLMVRSVKKAKQKAVYKKYCNAKYSNIGKIDFEKLNRNFLK